MVDSFARITWRPGISDPSVLAWTITLALLAAGGACLVQWRRSHQPVRLSIFWALSAGLFVFLACNKQLDFQVLLIQLGRDWTADHHWFQHRRGLQTIFAVVLAAVATGGVLAFAWTLRSHWSGMRLALAGVACTLTVVLAQVAVLCHVLDRLIWSAGTTPSTVHHTLQPLELAGPLCVIVFVWRSGRRL